MYAVIGVTGQVGSVVARRLLASGKDVRAIVRSADKAAEWHQVGCEVAIADIANTDALASALAGTEGAFVMLPPNFDPSPDFAEPRALIASLVKAVRSARPAKVVCLSTIGAQASQPNLLQPLGWLELELRALPLPVTFLRAAWFMENFVWDVPAVRDEGVLPSFLQPNDRAIPMVATADVGQVAAELLQSDWTGSQIVELEGPVHVSPQDVAACFASVLGREVRVQDVARDQWESLFKAHGMKNPLPRIQMLDGFNQGWLKFETNPRKGGVGLGTVLRLLAERSA